MSHHYSAFKEEHVRGGKDDLAVPKIGAREKLSPFHFDAMSRGDNKSKHTSAVISPRVLLTTVIHLEDARRQANLKGVVFHAD